MLAVTKMVRHPVGGSHECAQLFALIAVVGISAVASLFDGWAAYAGIMMVFFAASGSYWAVHHVHSPRAARMRASEDTAWAVSREIGPQRQIAEAKALGGFDRFGAASGVATDMPTRHASPPMEGTPGKAFVTADSNVIRRAEHSRGDPQSERD